MSDTLNALQTANRTSSVLQSIANPAQVNPLAATQAGISAASNEYDLAAKQGSLLVGQALQQATDENGNLDFAKAQKIAAGMGPSAALAMQGFLKTSSQLRGEQITQGGALDNLTSTLAASAIADPSDANLASIRARGVANNLPPSALAEIDRIAALPDPAQRKLEAWKHLSGQMGASYNLAVGGYPTPVMTTMPQGQVGISVQPPSPYSPGGVSTGGAPAPSGIVSSTLSPAETAALPNFTYTNPATGRPVTVPGADAIKIFGYGVLLPPGAQGHVDLPPGWTQVSGGGGAGSGGGGGVVGNDGKPVSPANPPRLLNVPNQPPAPAAPGAPAASPGAPGGPSIGAAMQAAPAAPAASQLPVPPIPPPVPPPAPGARDSMMPGPRSSLEGGVPVASANPLLTPAVGAPGPPSPLVPGDVNAIMAGMNRARASPAQGTQTAAAFSFGPSAEETQGFKTSADKLAADDLAATEWQSTKLPYVEALKNYGEGTKTGPTTDFWNQVAGTIRTPLAKIGINVGPLSDTTERVDALGKWLASIQSTNPVSAKSDAELAQVLKGSASTHINEVAGEDMVKAGFTLKRMGFALNNDWHNNPALQAQYGTYLRYLGDMSNKIDPRAFSIDMLNDKGPDSQMARLRAQLNNGSEADAARFEASLALARRTGQIR